MQKDNISRQDSKEVIARNRRGMVNRRTLSGMEVDCELHIRTRPTGHCLQTEMGRFALLVLRSEDPGREVQGLLGVKSLELLEVGRRLGGLSYG